MIEQTFAMIKPDAVENKLTGKIIDIIEQHGFEILTMQKGQLTQEIAESFYEVHKEKPFFKELVEFIISGPVVVMALEKENAVADWRKLMGATDPKKAEQGTIRNLFGKDISNNVVHGSDSLENAGIELGIFFGDDEDDETEE